MNDWFQTSEHLFLPGTFLIDGVEGKMGDKGNSLVSLTSTLSICLCVTIE